MYFRLLYANLRKKKGQSTAMAMLICISLALLITSVQIYNISTSQIDAFVSKSNIASLIIWKSYAKDDESKIEQLVIENDYINNVNTQDALSLNGDAIQCGPNRISFPSSLSIFLTNYDNVNNIVFPSDAGSKIVLEPGKIAIPVYISELTGTGIGDTVIIAAGEQEYSFTVQTIFKDALFGSEYISTKRVLLNTSDLFALLDGRAEQQNTIVSFNLADDSQVSRLISDYSAAGLEQQFSIDKNLLGQIYQASNGIIGVIFLIAATFISLLCFFIQRYSVVTTLQDEYEQIALMKATGFWLSQIKRIYMVKYSFVGLVGMIFGIGLGKLLSAAMTQDFANSIVIVNQWQRTAIFISCAVGMLLLFIALAYLQMNKIKQFTPVELASMPHLQRKSANFPVKLYQGKVNTRIGLAVNDIANKPKSYVKYTITLVLCLSLVLVLSNLKTTIQSSEFINYFGLTVGDIYTDISVENNIRADVVELVDNYNNILADNGEDITLGIDFYKDARIIDGNGISSEITALKSSSSTGTFRFISGTAPQASNEVALTTVLMNRYNKTIGDTIILEIDGVPKEYTITSSNQALYNMGEIILLPDIFEITGERVSYQVIAYISPTVESVPSYLTYLQSQYDFLKGATSEQIISRMTGNMIEQIALAIDILIVIMLFFLCLIVLLFTSLICIGETSSVRILQSIGINKSFLLSYQGIRIGVVVLASLIVGCFLSVTVGRILTTSIFAITGLAKFDLINDFMNTFVYLPIIFSVVTICLSIFVHSSDNKKQIRIV